MEKGIPNNKDEMTFSEIPEHDMEFIPEVEIDPVTREPKKSPFKQAPYKPLTDYGG